MSIQAVSWALEQIAPMAPKFILVCLANYADADGECWPALKTIAKNAGCGQRSVQRYLDELCELGLVEKVEQKAVRGKFSTTLYRLPIRPVANLTSGQSDHRPNRPVANRGHSPMATGGVRNEPSIEPSNTTTAETRATLTEDLPSEGPLATVEPKAPTLQEIGTLDAVARIFAEVSSPQLDPHRSHSLFTSQNHVGRWLRAGIDLDAVIIPTIKSQMSRHRNGPVQAWTYFDGAIRDAQHRYLESLKDFDLGESHVAVGSGPVPGNSKGGRPSVVSFSSAISQLQRAAMAYEGGGPLGECDDDAGGASESLGIGFQALPASGVV